MKPLLAFSAAALILTAPLAALAQNAHDSNTLHKLGKAIQYPVRKAGENTSKAAHKTAKSAPKAAKAVQYPVNKAGQNASITTHRATGKNSVTTVKPTDSKTVVTPSGDKKPAGTGM